MESFIYNSTIESSADMTSLSSNISVNASNAECNNTLSSLAENSVFINKNITPFIYVIGFPGNIFSFIIWMRPRMRHSSGVYLSALAIVDFIFLGLHMLFELNTMWTVNTLHYPVICESFTIIFLTFQYLAPLLVLAFTIERYISICHPFKREQFCTTKRARIVSTCLALGCLAICAIQGYFWTFTKGECSIREEVTIGGNKSLWNIWSIITEMIIFLVVPLCVLIFNILVILEARRMSKYEQSQMHSRSTKSSATTFMLLAVSFYLIFTTLPVTVVYVSVLNFNPGEPCVDQNESSTWRRYYIYLIVRAVIEEIGITHFALNFYIYLLTGKMFRNEFKKMFLNFLGKAIPERIRTEYTTLGKSVGGSVKKTMTVRMTENGASKGTTNGTETHV